MRGLDRLITIERGASTRDDYGQIEDNWTILDDRRPAACQPLRGDERFTAEQFVARQQVVFTVRWSENIADLSPLDRIIYPADSSSPAVPDIYDIMDVQEIGRREGFRILAARRAET